VGKRQKPKATVNLVKMFRDYPDKVIYRGTLKEAKRRIPPSKKEQFRIDFFRNGS
jgi:hypothetical protein